MLLLPLRGEAWDDGLVHHLLHHREGVERHLPLAALYVRLRLRKTRARERRRCEEKGRECAPDFRVYSALYGDSHNGNLPPFVHCRNGKFLASITHFEPFQ